MRRITLCAIGATICSLAAVSAWAAHTARGQNWLQNQCKRATCQLIADHVTRDDAGDPQAAVVRLLE